MYHQPSAESSKSTYSSSDETLIEHPPASSTEVPSSSDNEQQRDTNEVSFGEGESTDELLPDSSDSGTSDTSFDETTTSSESTVALPLPQPVGWT